MSGARFDPECRAMLDEASIHDPRPLVQMLCELIPGTDGAHQIYAAMIQTAYAFMVAPEETYALFATLKANDPLLQFLAPRSSKLLAEIACWLYENGDTRQKAGH